MSALLEGERDPFARASFEPGHFTASSFVLSPDEQSVLLVFHRKLKRWLQPGGHVDPEDSDIVSAAQREVAEEVGLRTLEHLGRGILDVDIHPIPALANDPPHEHFDVRFLFRSPTLAARAGSDAKAVRWASLDDITTELTDASVLRAVTKIREPTHH